METILTVSCFQYFLLLWEHVFSLQEHAIRESVVIHSESLMVIVVLELIGNET